MRFREVGNKMLEYSVSNRYLKMLLPFSYILLIGASGLSLLNMFVSIGSVMNAIVYFAFFFGLVLTAAKAEYHYMSIGLGLKAVYYLFSFLRSLIKYHNLAFGTLIYLLVFGWFTYLAYKESKTV